MSRAREMVGFGFGCGLRQGIKEQNTMTSNTSGLIAWLSLVLLVFGCGLGPVPQRDFIIVCRGVVC